MQPQADLPAKAEMNDQKCDQHADEHGDVDRIRQIMQMCETIDLRRHGGNDHHGDQEGDQLIQQQRNADISESFFRGIVHKKASLSVYA